MRVWYHNANEQVEQVCENCFYATATDIDGLIDCLLDGHSKDDDMTCQHFEPQG
jgi:hypothetical protein